MIIEKKRITFNYMRCWLHFAFCILLAGNIYKNRLKTRRTGGSGIWIWIGSESGLGSDIVDVGPT